MHHLTRRRFIEQAALAGAALTFPLPSRSALAAAARRATPVRIRGRVEAGGGGLARVGVTDGLTVVTTEPDGRFELISSTRQAYVHLCLPAGYAFPQNTTGTARFYEPIQPNAQGEMTVRFALTPHADDQHAFFVLADPQTQDAYEMGLLHEQTVPDIRMLAQTLGDRPLFGVACGDIMFDDLSLYPEYERAVDRMGVPFFQVVGNHDLNFDSPTDRGSAQTFSRHFGPTYYSFDQGAVHYVVLDDVFWQGQQYFGYLDADQLAWLEQDLARVEAGRTVVVFLHIPALSTQFRRRGEAAPSSTVSVTNRAALYRLLEPYQAHLISGHTHEQEHVFEGGTHEHVLGATCGAWWSGPICNDGTPNGYGVFEARGEELRWQYKATGAGLDHQLRLYNRGADPTAPDEIVANVWDWDPAWTVVWYEDGIRKGAMAQRLGTDPLSEEIHRGRDKPSRRPWVEPLPTRHLFYAPVAADARTVRVEATDRWGRTFSETLPAASGSN